VSVTVDMIGSHRRLWSKEGPLAWYVNHQLRQGKDGNIWPDRQCYNWFVKETKEGSDWLNELEVGLSSCAFLISSLLL